MAFVPASAFAATTQQSLIIPGYKYPTTWTSDPYWDTVTGTNGAHVPFVIVNANSGPGTATNPDYETQLANNAAANIRNIGYVALSYGSKSFSDVTAEIDAWHSLYDNVSGIFLDEYSANAAEACDAAAVYNYIKTKYPSDTIIANPGVHIDAAVAPYADIFVTAEMSASNYLGAGYTAPTSNFETDPNNQNRIMHIIHSVANSDYAAVLDKTRQENAAFVYITDDTMPTPYDALTTNFSTLHPDIQTLPSTTIPHGSVVDYPECVDIETTQSATTTSAAATSASTTTTLTLTNVNTSSHRYETPLRVAFSATGPVERLSFAGMGWECTENACIYRGGLDVGAATSALAITAETVCSDASELSYAVTSVSGSTTYGNGQLALETPSECDTAATPVSTEDANSNDQAGLADTGVSAIMLALIGSGTLLVGTALALTLRRHSR